MLKRTGLTRYFEAYLRSLWGPLYLGERAFDRLMRTYGPELRGRVVDIGCGQKANRGYCPNVTAYVGLDYTCRHENPFTYQQQRETRDIEARGDCLPLSRESCDSVMLIGVLEHVEDFAAVIAEAHRVLKPGGRILLTVPFMFYEHLTPVDYWRFTRFGTRYYYDKLGYRNIRVEQYGGFWTCLGRNLANYLYIDLLGSGPRRKYVLALALPLLTPLFFLLNLFCTLCERGGNDSPYSIAFCLCAEKT
jgi:SAM-dependent methyltransferase